MPVPRRRVAILGIDTFAAKNRLQVEQLNARGWWFDVFTPDARGDSGRWLPEGNSLVRLTRSPLARLNALARYFRSAGSTIHHAEIYPGGRFAWVYLAMARRAGVPTIVVERGDLLGFATASWPLRAAMRLTYRHADLVWYREPYAERELARLGAPELAFLPNAVAIPGELAPPEARDIDFLWVNRFIPERRADWFIEALGSPALQRTRALLLGLLPPEGLDPAARAAQARVLATRDGITIGPFSPPAPAYARSRFFVLPATIVYGNHSLLEAMAHGVVPVVSRAHGVERLVQDGHNGILFAHSREGLQDALERAQSLDEGTRCRMAVAARDTVLRAHSPPAYADALEAIYRGLAP